MVFGFRVQGLGFRIYSVGYWGFGFRVLGFRVLGFRVLRLGRDGRGFLWVA